MEYYALGYNERSSRSKTLGTRHLHYTRSRAQSPVLRELPVVPEEVQDDKSKEQSNNETKEDPPAEETKETKSENSIENATEGTPSKENAQEPNKE